MKNKTCWQDTEGHLIQAHGGCILERDGTYYWYGENKDTETRATSLVGHRVDFSGFSCYSSTNLQNWKNEGVVLAAGETGSPIGPECVGERPSVLYHARSGSYIMWFHHDDEYYQKASVGLAVAASPAGPFVYKGSMRPNGRESRDFTLYVDQDETAYMISSSDANSTLLISRLDEEYTGFTGEYTTACEDQFREAPVVLFEDGRYYMFSSGCTGWAPNVMLYAESNKMMGNWRLIDNPCEGPDARMTYYGQSACAVKHQGDWYLMLDHWHPQDLRTSGYSLLKIQFSAGRPLLPFTETVSIG